MSVLEHSQPSTGLFGRHRVLCWRRRVWWVFCRFRCLYAGSAGLHPRRERGRFSADYPRSVVEASKQHSHSKPVMAVPETLPEILPLHDTITRQYHASGRRIRLGKLGRLCQATCRLSWGGSRSSPQES